MGSVSGGGVRGSESDRWKRGLLGRVDNAFCQSADDTGYTASVSYGPVCKILCVQKLCAQREGLCTHMPCRSSCGLRRGFCEVGSAPSFNVVIFSAVIIIINAGCGSCSSRRHYHHTTGSHSSSTRIAPCIFPPCTSSIALPCLPNEPPPL